MPQNQLASINAACMGSGTLGQAIDAAHASHTREWACGKAWRCGGKFKNVANNRGEFFYRVGYTLFVDHAPAERCTIEFWASKPAKALDAIHASGKHPIEFDGHNFG